MERIQLDLKMSMRVIECLTTLDGGIFHVLGRVARVQNVASKHLTFL